MADTYDNFKKLAAVEKENIDFKIFTEDAKSRIAIVAPHGGGIEPGTSEIARSISDGKYNCYCFEGIKSERNKELLHITSTNFDEPRCVELVQKADTVIAIHGEGSDEQSVFLGGRDDELGEELKSVLERYGYAVKIHENSDLQGLNEANICNRGRHGVGVQLELSSGLRQTFFRSLTAKGREKPTGELVRFVAAVCEGLHSAGRL